MSERWFKCGACGTEARGFRSDMMLAGFQDDHATICPGFPPATEAALQRPTPEVFSCPECGSRRTRCLAWFEGKRCLHYGLEGTGYCRLHWGYAARKRRPACPPPEEEK